MTDGLRSTHGGHRPGDQWMGPLDEVDRRVLERVEGPALDVGCGPARHTLALAERGVTALGIDITRALLDLARPRGVVVMERDVFARVPAEGRWGTILLLDGNVGLGGDAVALLRRASALLRPGGLVLAEVEAPGSVPAATGEQVRVDVGGELGPWFGWDRVCADGLATVAASAGLGLECCWSDEARWFAALRTHEGTSS